MMTTGSSFDGYRVEKYIGIINKEILVRVGLSSALDAAIQNISLSHFFGNDAEAKGSSALIQRAKENLSEQFEAEAVKRGANAILGIDYETTILENQNVIRVAMNGTAVQIEKIIPAIRTDEPDGIIRIPVSKTNMEEPFLPASAELAVLNNGIDVVLKLKSTSEAPSGIEADVTFLNLFGDEITIHDLVFLDIYPVQGNRFASVPSSLTLPSNFYRCLRECFVLVRKYISDGRIYEAPSHDLQAFDASPSFDDAEYASLLDTLDQYETADEMISYLNENGMADKDGRIREIYEALDRRSTMERFYGKNHTFTMNALRKVIEGKPEQ